MPSPTFKRLSLEQFSLLLAAFPFTRQINSVHMHHTWRPNRAQFRGHETIVSMWTFHTQTKGWSDIAQHVTIDPEGFIWLGRNWNLPPASAAGHNGNGRFGPFMFEMIGDFDAGRDRFDGEQRETALQVVARVQTRFDLANNTLKFHNTMSIKSCPGSSLVYADILTAVDERKAAGSQRARTARAAPKGPFPDEQNLVVADSIAALGRTTSVQGEPADAEMSHDKQAADALGAGAADLYPPRDVARDSGLSAAELAALRPHLVNLKLGRFSDEEEAMTTAADVDAIFEQHLPAALAAAKTAGGTLRVVFYAHGGLVSESSGLRIAARHIGWWKQNRVYPIYFVWETGFFETIGQLLMRAQQRTARALGRDIFDFTTDPLLELAARALQGPRIWGGMKASAEHAVDAPTASNPHGGGARYVASKLKAFCDANPNEVELHAVGHSAGAVFHSHFLPVARALDVPTFAGAHFFAPAVRVDTFKENLAPVIGDGKAAKHLTLFTMKRDFERDDDCAGVYRKSLLYLIHNALEDKRSTAILGLEDSLRGDGKLKALFGLGGSASSLGEVVWSPSPGDTGRSASRSESHGGFDDDAPTMNSVARRILGKADADPIVDYPKARDARDASRSWTEEIDWPEELRPSLAPMFAAGRTVGDSTGPYVSPQVAHSAAPAGSGRRRALCVGVDRYPDPRHRLAGCVADARMWANALGRLGFEATLLTDEQATRAALQRELLSLVSDSRMGDVIVFQYAGHGTHVPDLDGDDEDGQDEALCPVDFASGALYIDDDIAEALAKLPDGVNLTCFMDCCHSGTNTRVAVGGPPSDGPRPGRDERKRYVVPTPEIIAAHKRFREQTGSSRAMRRGGQRPMPDVKVSACLDREVAWESDGHGEFTLRATRILAAGLNGLSNEQFAQRVSDDFGAGARQHPMLDCAPEARSRLLLEPLARETSAPTAFADSAGTPNHALLAQTLTSVQLLLTQMAAK